MEVVLKRNEPGSIQQFTIYGKPGSKQSVRVSGTYNELEQKVKIHQYQKKKDVDNQNYLAWCIKGQLPFGWKLWDGPIIVRELQYVFYPPKKYLNEVKKGEFIYVNTKPDLTDNLNKMLFDAMNNIVYVDDKQIVEMHDVVKYYGLEPKTILILEHVK